MTATLIEGIIGSTSGALVSWWSSRKKQRHFQGLDANTARAAINAKLAAAKTEPEREAARKEAKDLSESLESVSWETVPVSKRVKLIVRWVGFVAAWILFSVGLFAWTMRTHYKATHYYQQLDKYVNQARMCRDKEKALQYYTEAIALFKKEGRGLDTDIPAVIYFERGRIYHQKDMYENAIQDYDYAIKYNGTQALYYGFRGLAYDEMKFYDKAISDYGEAIRLDNTQAAHYLARGVVYCLKQDWDTAIADFNQAIKLDNKCAEAYRYRHIVHKAKGNLAQANADYQQAIAIKPELVKSVKTKQ
jgi:tetratricopeptide (TPR) repeat protein